MEDHQITSQSTNNNTHKPYSQLYKQLVFTNLKLNHSPQNATINTLKERILYILDEIQRQDVGETHTGPPSDKVIETKTQDYYYNSESYSKQTDSQLTPSKEKERLLQVQELKRTNAYQTIMDLYQPQLQSLLRHKNNSYKTKPELFLECGNKQCKLQIDITPFECQNTTDAVSCEPLKRLEVMLAVYKELKEQDTLWRKVPIADILYVKDLYGYQQLCNDWLHVKIVHIDGDPDKDTPNAMARRLCTRYAENPKWSCSHLSNCAGYQRHYRDRTNDQLEQQLYFRRSVRATLNKTERILNNKDIVYQQECDKIHSFLLHSTIKWGTSLNRTKFKPTPTCETQTSNISKHSEGRSCSFSKEMLIGSTQQLELPLAIEEQTETSATNEPFPQFTGSYIGRKEDEAWWENIDSIEINLEHKGINSGINRGFGELVSKMGIFRYQSAHGFRCGQNRGLHHLKPRFKNIKEEVLHNCYYPLSVSTWNQTVRKSKVFFQSWARHKMRTLYDGQYNDQITGVRTIWHRGCEITLTEIVTFKLYTDYDKLQFHLKKCFRWETIMDIWDREQSRRRQGLSRTEEDPTISAMRRTMSGDNEKDSEAEHAKHLLETRLKQFFHWRSEILVVLNKFGRRMGDGDQNLVLYHGVNAKMILNPTETMAFYGPLSTTSSLHVARTFATKKGMVLKLTTHYPRTNVCKAFDASLISDYPEEQEWLIGFIYLRVLEVQTEKIGVYEDDDGWRYSNEGSWNASMIRSIFFGVNLFREQMFSMSPHLESHLKAFLQQISPLEYDIDEDKLKQTTEYLEDVIHNRKHNISNNANTKNNERKRKIFKILWEKFDEFRQEPNMEQIIKIDTISDGLKPYFLDESSAKDIHNKRILWDISFDKILALFPNAQEIHFLNQYTLNNVALKRLIRQIKKPKNKLKRVKFLYYEYNEVPTESSYFYPPDSLKEDSIQELTNGMRTDDNQLKKWKFVKSETKNVGYKIRLYEVSDPNEPYRIASRQTRRHSLTINKTH
eukprot:881385_1